LPLFNQSIKNSEKIPKHHQNGFVILFFANVIKIRDGNKQAYLYIQNSSNFDIQGLLGGKPS